MYFDSGPWEEDAMVEIIEILHQEYRKIAPCNGTGAKCLRSRRTS
jgi:hypothetical protein